MGLGAAVLLLGFPNRLAAQTLEVGSDEPEPISNSTNGLGSWIWAAQTFDRQTCRFWRAFDLPATNAVKQARLRMTVDNEYVLFLDGREIGNGSEWREIYVFDLTPLLFPGHHVLAIKAVNSTSAAGMILGLQVELADGQMIEVKSDLNWRIAPEEAKRWEKRATAPENWVAPIVVGAVGVLPRWTLPQNVNRMPTLMPLEIRFWQTGWFKITLLVLLSLLSLFSIRLLAQLAFHRRERLLLERERSRIAADIHDDLGSRVTQLVLHGEVAQNDLAANSLTREQLERICEEARQVLSSMDGVLWAVNPERDTLRDFTAFVCCYAEEFLKSTPIQCRLEVEPEMSTAALDLPLRRNLLMAIKETLNNAVKHSAATEVLLKIHWQGQKLTVVVQDNGRGFNPVNATPGRNGLTNMERRMKELGGSCRLSSQPGQGCRVEFAVPLNATRRFSLSWLWRTGHFTDPPPPPKPAPESAPPSHDRL